MVAPITIGYAIVLAVIFFFLSVQVINTRRTTHTSLGDGAHTDLQRRIRAHGNFAEYVPFILGLLLLAELHFVSSWLLHVIGASLVVGRCLHWYGLTQHTKTFTWRVVGMAATLSALLIATLSLLYIVVDTL